MLNTIWKSYRKGSGVMRSMVMKQGGESIHHICPGCEFKRDGKDRVPLFKSDLQAYQRGWRKTVGSRFCPADGTIAWVCPECWPGDM